MFESLITTLRYFLDNSASFCPLVKYLGIFERLEQAATFAFGFMKKYLVSKKLEHNTFLFTFLVGRFWGKNTFFIYFQNPDIFEKFQHS